MFIKKIITTLILIMLLFSGKSKNSKDYALFKKIEAEKLNIEGGYNIIRENNYKYVRVNNFSEITTTIKAKINKPSVLWMNVRMIDASKVTFSINDKKILLNKDQYYFKWIKIGEFDNINNIDIKIDNEFSLIEIDRFYITSQGTAPFAKEYVIDDVKCDYDDEKVKILFSGEDLQYADTYLYKKMTAESYIKYLEDKYGRINRFKKFWLLIDYIFKPYEKVSQKKIEDLNDYYIYDEKPVSGYDYEYYITIKNLFGQSLKSKKLVVHISKDPASESGITVQEVIKCNNLFETYSFERYKNDIVSRAGFINKTKTEQRLYINNKNTISHIPSFLKDSYYYTGLKDAENVTFNINKPTDIYIYIPDLEKSYKEYYLKKGFRLIRIPSNFTSNEEDGYTYFYYKKYRQGTGDALYLKNIKSKIDVMTNKFSTMVDSNDLVVYFNAEGTLLEGAEELFIKYNKTRSHYEDDEEENDRGHRSHGKKNKKDIQMSKIQDNLWTYRIKNGAVKYKELDFEFYNDEYNESDPEWTWNIYDYYMNYKKQLSSVVFFKELENKDIDMDFNEKYHSEYLAFEGYLLDDGSLKNTKGKEYIYGTNKELNVNDYETKSKDNTKGFYDGSFLTIEYDSLNTALVDSEYIRIIYSYDNWITEDNILMQDAGYKKWMTELYPPSDKSKISYYFTDDNVTDDNYQTKWSWDYKKNQYYNIGYERNITKRKYLELKPFINNDTDNYYWSIDIDNGVYDVYLILQKENKYNEAKIDINEKTFTINENHNEIVELREKIIVYNNQISIKNTGDENLKIFSLLIKRDKKNINTGFLMPESFQYDNLVFDKDIADPFVILENDDDIIEIEFDMESIINEEKIELVVNASTNNKSKLFISTENNFDNDDLVTEFFLDNDLKEYTLDLTPYKEEIINNDNKLTLYIKGNRGTKILTHKNSIAPFGIKSSIELEGNQEVYEAMGIISHDGTNFIFTEDGTNVNYISSSDVIDLNNHKDSLVIVSGYIEDNKLTILKITPIITIKSIEGDTYTNNQILNWTVISDQPLTGLKYRIKDVTDWKIMTFGVISESVEEDGEYVLEVIPMMNGAYGQVYTHNFIVDRMGPALLISGIDEYITTPEIEFNVDYNDNYCNKEDITVYYSLYSPENEMIELTVTDNKAVINLYEEAQVEGEISIFFIAKDVLENEGALVVKETVIDITKPELDMNISNVLKPGSTTNERIILVDFRKFDNMTATDDIVVHYNINDLGYLDATTDNSISFDTAPFEDGEYPFTAYAVDKGGLRSDVAEGIFIIDTIPIDKPMDYFVEIEDDQLVLSWTSRNDDPTFAYYKIRRDPVFDFADNDYTITQANEFKDIYSLFDPDYTYYVSVIDKYGNISEELECSAIKPTIVQGNPGETKTADFEDSSITVKLLDDKPVKLAVLKHDKIINPNVIADYNLVSEKIYFVGPEGTTFPEPVLWSIDVSDVKGVENKENLTVYYYNRTRNYWEEVESVYNNQTDKLEAKLHHFSTYGVGQKKDNKINEPVISTNISPMDGSLNASISAAEISSYEGNFSLNLKFNSKMFDQMSKFMMSEEAKNNDKKIECTYTMLITPVASNKIADKAKDIANRLENKDYYSIIPGTPEDDKIGKQTVDILEYKDYIQKINYIDNAWDMNIPELISDDPTSDNYKYIKFDDGIYVELKPYNGVYRNKNGKRFIYKELADDKGYLVKCELYKNYKFNKNGKVEYIFYSNNPEDVINDISANQDKIIFKFNYDENDVITEIISYDKLGNDKYKIEFTYIDIKDVDDQDNDYFIKRLTEINKLVKIDGTYKKMSGLKLNYKNIQITEEPGNSYLLVYNHDINNKGENIIINYERLESVEYITYDFVDDTLPAVTRLSKIDYTCEGAEYDIINKNNEKYPFSGVKNLEIPVPFVKANQDNDYFLYETVEMTLPIEFIDVKFKGNNRIKSISNISVDEKEGKKTFGFKSYERIAEWNIHASYIYNYCYEQTSTMKDNEENLLENLINKNNYHYKENTKLGISPFENSLRVTPDKFFTINNRDNSTMIDNRDISLVKEETNNNKYLFDESELDGIYGIKSKRVGVFYHQYYYTVFDAKYSSMIDGISLSLEDIVGNDIAYSKDIIETNGNNQITGSIKFVKQLDSTDEKIMQKEKFEYEDDKILKKYSYLNNNDRKTIKYNYRNLSDYFGSTAEIKEEEEFLFTQIDSMEEEMDDNRSKIEKNHFNRTDTGEVQVVKKEYYLSDDPSKKYEKEMEYDDYNRIIKDVDVLRETADDSGLRGKTNEVKLDSLNNITEIKVSGTSKVLEAVDQIKDGKLTLMQNNYYNKRNNTLLADEKYPEGKYNNRIINLYFSNYKGNSYKTVVLYYDNGTLLEYADVSYNYYNEYFKDQIHVSGSFNRIEKASYYESYYNDIVSDGDYFEFQNTEIIKHETEIQKLKDSNFDYKTAGIDITLGGQTFHYLNYDLLQETYKVRINKDDTKEIYKRYITFKVDSANNIISRMADNYFDYHEYTWEYDELGNNTKESFPDDYLPPIKYSTTFENYYKDITKETAGLKTLERYDNMNNIIYLKLSTNDKSMTIEEYNDYDLAGLIKKSTGINNIIAEMEYNYFGLTKKTIDNPDDNINKRTIERNVYNNIGKSIYGYSDMLINSVSFNPMTDWISTADYDDFGNNTYVVSKPDTEILKDGITPVNLEAYTLYNVYGKEIYQTSNRFKLNSITADDKLSDVEIKYTSTGNMKEKISYGWNPEDKVLITYKESFEYDKYKRVTSQTKEYKNGSDPWKLLEKTIIDQVNHNGNVIKAYKKERGKNWVESENIYNDIGKLETSITRVTNISTDNFTQPTAYIMEQKKYIKYDEYGRETAVVDFDKSNKYIVYNNSGEVSEEYIGVNFTYNIVNNRITNINTGSPVTYTYNDGGLRTSEKLTDKNSGEILYEKYYTYDKYGRPLSESINRYKNNILKYKTIYYDGIGRVEKTVTDELTETITQWEDENNPKIITMTFNSGSDQITYTNIIKYSRYGNVIESIDRDNYKFINRVNNFGKTVESIKSKDSQNIFTVNNIFDETEMFLTSATKYSPINQNMINSKLEYLYDKEGRPSNITLYDIDNSLTIIKENSKKFIEYTEDSKVKKIDYYIDGEFIDDIEYFYNEAGALTQINYPEDKKQYIYYDDVIKDGRLDKVTFQFNTAEYNIVNELEYLNNSLFLQAYTTGINTKTTLGYDAANRINSKSFEKIATGEKLTQNYSYDKMGKITQVKEHRSAGSTIVETAFTRNFGYDEYNRLIKGEYTGSFTHEIKPKLTYQNFDYDPSQDKIAYKELINDRDKMVNIEYGSPSILVSDKYGNEQELKPEIIRIYKNQDSHLKDVMINPLYHDNDKYYNLENSMYTIESNKEYFEINNWDIDLTKIIKLNFDLDNRDMENNPMIDSDQNKKLDDIVKFYSKADNIDIEYSYDVMGNRLSKKETLTKNNKNLILEDHEETYIYSDDKRLLLEDDLYNYEYDLNGQLSKKIIKENTNRYWEYKWDNMNHLRKITKYNGTEIEFQEEYIYDEAERRIKTIGKDYYVLYLYEGLKLIFEKRVEGNKETTKNLIYAFDKLQAVFEKVKEDENIEHKSPNYYFADILESTRFIVNAVGIVLQENIFTPFGRELINSMKSSVNKLHYQYASHHYQNEETGLTYMIGRWMDNKTGRFINADTKKDGVNYYVYAMNNPTTFIDPDGHIVPLIAFAIAVLVCVIVFAIIGSIVGGVIGGIAGYNYAQNQKKAVEKQGGTYGSSLITLHVIRGAGIGAGIGLVAGAILGALAGLSAGAAAVAAVAVAGAATSAAIIGLVSVIIVNSLIATSILVGGGAFIALGAADYFFPEDLKPLQAIFGAIGAMGQKDVYNALSFINYALGDFNSIGTLILTGSVTVGKKKPPKEKYKKPVKQDDPKLIDPYMPKEPKPKKKIIEKKRDKEKIYVEPNDSNYSKFEQIDYNNIQAIKTERRNRKINFYIGATGRIIAIGTSAAETIAGGFVIYFTPGNPVGYIMAIHGGGNTATAIVSTVQYFKSGGKTSSSTTMVGVLAQEGTYLFIENSNDQNLKENINYYSELAGSTADLVDGIVSLHAFKGPKTISYINVGGDLLLLLQTNFPEMFIKKNEK